MTLHYTTTRHGILWHYAVYEPPRGERAERGLYLPLHYTTHDVPSHSVTVDRPPRGERAERGRGVAARAVAAVAAAIVAVGVVFARLLDGER